MALIKQRLRRVIRALREDIRADTEKAVRSVINCGGSVVLTRVSNGRHIYLDMRDSATAAPLALGQGGSEHVAAVLKTMIRPQDNFFDVGANFGQVALLLWDDVQGAERPIHLFEPNPTVYRCLQRTVHLNGWGAHLNNTAVSDRSGSAPLHIYRDLWGSARLQNPAELASSGHPWTDFAEVEETVQVPMVTLDEYCDERGIDRIGVMKIDTEGHEDAVIRGMSRVIDRSTDLRIVMEFTFGAYEDAEAFWVHLSRLFPHRFFIEPGETLVPVTDLESLRAHARSELADVALSKVPLSTL